MNIIIIISINQIKLISFSNNIDITSNNVSAFGLSPEDEIEKLFRYCDSKNLKRIKVILPENIYGNKIKNGRPGNLLVSVDVKPVEGFDYIGDDLITHKTVNPLDVGVSPKFK